MAFPQGGLPGLKYDEDPTQYITELYISQVVEVFPETYTVRVKDSRGTTKAKVLTARASERDGSFDMPRVGEFVLVGYVGGQLTDPVVLGSFFPLHSAVTGEQLNPQERKTRRVKTHTDGSQVIEDAIIEYIETEKGDVTISVTAKEQGTGNITLNLTGNGQYHGKLEANVSGAVQINVAGEVEFSFDKSFVARVLNKITLVNKDMRFGGEDASEQLVLGNVFQRLFDTFIQFFNSHTHIGNLGSSTGPPLTPAHQLDGSELSNVARTKKG